MDRKDYLAMALVLIIRRIETGESVSELMQAVSEQYPVLTDKDLAELREIAISCILLWHK